MSSASELLRRPGLLGFAALFASLSFVLPLGETVVPSVGAVLGQAAGQATESLALRWSDTAAALVFACFCLFGSALSALRPPRDPATVWWLALLGGLAACAPLMLSGAAAVDAGRVTWGAGFWCYLVGLALLAMASVRRMAALDLADPAGRRSAVYGTPLLFGVWVLVFWQLGVRTFEVPRVLLPAPSLIGRTLLGSAGVLLGDFEQTVLHSALIGLAIGAGLGFGVALAIDRSPFLQRGLLPIAALASAVPLVGIAPVMVMWFGFDWHSKAAVVVVMTFFPMLVNTLAGLKESGRMERDLMRSFGAGYGRTLLALRLPVALPFVFNALKIDSTLAMIGAIVAEFFGSPTAGLGFRISTEAARLDMGLVWAAITVAALAGSLLYGLLSWIERRATFWHPSLRSRA